MTFVAIVLAAGAGRRFGGGKMQAEFRGEPLIRHAIRAARAAPVGRVIVVRPPDLALGDWPGSPVVEAVTAESDALSTSLKAGIRAAEGASGAFVFLGDMPLVPHGAADALAAILGDNFAAVPRYEGRSGHPVLFAARAFPALAKLQGDHGAGILLASRDDIAFDDCSVGTILLDIDRVEDIERLEGRPREEDRP